MPSGAARSTSSRPTAPATRPRSRASARRSATRSRSSPRPGRMAFYDRLCAEVPPSLVELLRIPGLGPQERPPDLHRARHRDDGGPAPGRRGRHAADACAGCRPRPSSSSSRASPGSSRRRSGCCSTGPRRLIAGPDGGADRHARASARSSPPARSGGASESIGDLDLLAETDDGPALIERVHDARRRRSRRQQGRLQGGRPAAPRPAGRPDGHAARHRRHVPHPLHGLQGAQRPPPRAGPRPGLEPVREGVPAHRRGRRAADRRRRRAPDVRHGGGGVRVPRPAVHRARAARGSAARSRRPSPARCRGSSSSATCAATCTATRTGRTASTRSRSWPRPPAGAATPTRS